MARLMTLLAEHWPEDTALARLFGQWQGDVGGSGAVLPLRLASGLHVLALNGQDAELVAVYPPNEADDAALLAAVLGALRRHDAFLCRRVEHAPQTNEVRRSAVLIAAAHWLDAHFGLPMRVSELGASAGLNLMFDKFRLDIDGQRWGPEQATIRLCPAWRGKLPPHATPRITERRGVDLNPLSVAHPEDASRLVSYIWPDQPDRMARTRAAMALQDAQVDRGDAVDWLARRLAAPQPGRLHLIYHTIAWQYFPADRQVRGREMIEAAGSASTDETPLVWLGMEADRRSDGAALSLRLWPGDISLDLGQADFHGQWVDWTCASNSLP
jgi:hypothetical protein